MDTEKFWVSDIPFLDAPPPPISPTYFGHFFVNLFPFPESCTFWMNPNAIECNKRIVDIFQLIDNC